MGMINLEGMRFGKLVVLRRNGSHPSNSRVPMWLVRCDCGREKSVRGHSLRRGFSRSCGCVHVSHGMRMSPEYRVWQSMRYRCGSSDDKNYGGRGISVCERWNNFSTFLADMGSRPSLKHSIDRINVNGNYEPDNCRWAVSKVQGRNKRTNHLLSVNGVTATLAEWSERSGIHKQTIRQRIIRGWGHERAVSTPVNQPR